MKVKVEYELSKKEEEIATITINEKKIYLNSRYNAESDFRVYIEKYNIKEDSIVALFGIESGIALKVLNEKLSSKGKIIVYDPIDELQDHFINKNKKMNPSITFIKKNNKNNRDMYFDIKAISKTLIKQSEIKKIVVIVQKKYEELFSNECSDFLKGINNAVKEKGYDLVSMTYFAENHIKNFIYNLEFVAKSFDISEFKNIFKDKPAIIVSAGPSLEKNFRLLKGNEDKFLIITGGRTLKVLLDEGIKPHFVVSMDPGEVNYNLFKEVLECDVPMVCQWLNNYKITIEYKGEKIFTNNTNIPNIDKTLLNKEILNFDQAGSVATTQFSLAEYMGCNPIAFIGQDLAYTEDKIHAEVASGKERTNKLVDKESLIKIKGNFVDEVYTAPTFKYVKEWFEKAIKANEKITVYNCTEGGAYIEGTSIDKLQNYIVNFSVNEDYYKKINNILNKKIECISELEIEHVMENINKSCLESIKLSNEAIKILEKIEILIKSNKKIEKLLKELNKIDKKLNENEKKSEFVVFFIQKELTLFQQIEMDEIDKTEEIINVNKNFYKTIMKAYQKATEIIDERKLFKLKERI